MQYRGQSRKRLSAQSNGAAESGAFQTAIRVEVSLPLHQPGRLSPFTFELRGLSSVFRLQVNETITKCHRRPSIFVRKYATRPATSLSTHVHRGLESFLGGATRMIVLENVSPLLPLLGYPKGAGLARRAQQDQARSTRSLRLLKPETPTNTGVSTPYTTHEDIRSILLGCSIACDACKLACQCASLGKPELKLGGRRGG